MKKYALGIDLGGTGTKFGLVNGAATLFRLSNIRISTSIVMYSAKE